MTEERTSFLADKSELKRQLYQCCKCGYCRDTISDELGYYHICPIYDLMRMEYYCGRGRATIALGIEEGILDFSEPLIDVIYTCLGCGTCREICPEIERVDVPAITRALREEITRRGLEPKKIREVNSALRETHNLFREETLRSEWAEDLNLPKEGETLYFAGCSHSYTYPKTARATVNILTEAGLDVSYLGEDEWCCGAPALWSGNTELFREIMEHNLYVIKTSKAKKVIFSCAVCYNSFNTHYRSLIGELPFEVLHISEVLADLIKKDRIHFRPLKKKLTYHDPCHLGRDEGIYEQPREVISKIPQTEFYEMPKNRKNASCCGEGVVVSILFPELTREISLKRVNEARKVGAEAIITCCPGCVTTLSKAAAWLKSKEKVKIEVYDLPVIVAESMGLKL